VSSQKCVCGLSYDLFVYLLRAERPKIDAGTSYLAEATEKLADVVDEEIGGVVSGPVAATVVLIPGDDVAMVALGEAADGREVVGEAGQARRDRRRLGRALGMVILVVEACRGRSGIRQPVDRDVSEDFIGT
jgi:hypothetical protein